MRISVFLDYTADPLVTAEMAIAADQAGIDMAWVAEAYGFDAVSILGYLAAKTDRIDLASGILPLGTRSATLLAMSAAGVDSVSKGRFTLGLGTSGPQVVEGFHGVTFDRPIARTRDTVEICRRVWEREPLEYTGETIQLPNPGGKPLRMMTAPLRSRIPITIASIGPKNVELTAEMAEGWLPMFGFFHPDRWRDVWGEPLDRGLAKRAPDLGPLDVVAGGEVAIGPGAEGHRERTRNFVALYVGGMGSRAQNFYNSLFRRYGYEEEATAIQDLFLDRKREEAAAAVPSDFLEATSLCGDDDFVRNQVARYRYAGVTNLIVRPVGDDRIGTLKKLRAIVDEVCG